jgi:hypothetical protein
MLTSNRLNGFIFQKIEIFIVIKYNRPVDWQRFLYHKQTPTKKKQTPGLQSASKLYRLSDRSLSAKLVPTLANRGFRVVSANPYSR